MNGKSSTYSIDRQGGNRNMIGGGQEVRGEGCGGDGVEGEDKGGEGVSGEGVRGEGVRG